MYYARFVAGASATIIDPSLKETGTIDNGVSFKIRSVDKPKVTLQTTELNQYNRKRFVYTKIDYQPITLRIFDSVDNKPLNLWKQYFTYYFGDSRPNKIGIMANDPTAPTFEDGSGWGLRPMGEDYFFKSVEVYSFYAGKMTQFNYLNPRISAIDFTQYDSSSSDPDDLSVTLRYEAIEYLPEQDIPPDLTDQFGFTGVPPVPDDELAIYRG